MSVCKDVGRGKDERKNEKKYKSFDTVKRFSGCLPPRLQTNSIHYHADWIPLSFSLWQPIFPGSTTLIHIIIYFYSCRPRNVLLLPKCLRYGCINCYFGALDRVGWSKNQIQLKKMIRTQKLNKELKNLCK